MTTIAANRSCMAGDQKVTDDGTAFRTTKIRRIGDTIAGAAGTSNFISKFFRWLEAGDQDADPPKPTKDDELAAIVLTPAGMFRYDTACEAEQVNDPFYAVGSGKQAALAAMHLGCDPAEAVEVACKVDDATGGPVDVLSL